MEMNEMKEGFDFIPWMVEVGRVPGTNEPHEHVYFFMPSP
jgi:hypothetical protein